jgi:pimeloyl-ACP methyl ester carboxylesterase
MTFSIRSGFTTALLPIALLSSNGCLGNDGDDPDPSCTGKCDGNEDIEIASDLPEVCKTAEVIRIERPVSESNTKDTFRYGFRFKAPTVEGAPVLVYLPGGPGQGAMDHAPEFVPEGWGYLMTDPRGVGCNRLAGLPDDSGAFFSTHELANDVIAAIEDRKLSNYILFGISYGTLLGTTVEHELEQRHVTPPKAVVLEGVLGRAFGMDFVGAEYLHQWDRVRAVLPADIVTELDTKTEPYGINATGWSKVLGALLPRGPGGTADLLFALSTTQPEDVRQQMLGALKEIADGDQLRAPGEVELYRQVACREIMDTVPANDLDVVFEAGKLVRNSAQEGTKCGALHVTKPYDAANLQFNTKLYLFIGDSDVATPAWQGAYHFEHHTGPAVRIITKNGGHNSLEFNQVDCAPKLMASIAAGGADLSDVVTSCPMQTTIDQK